MLVSVDILLHSCSLPVMMVNSPHPMLPQTRWAPYCSCLSPRRLKAMASPMLTNESIVWVMLTNERCYLVTTQLPE